MRLDLLLIRRHPGLSRRKSREVIEKGQVSVDGAVVREAGGDVSESAKVVFDPNRKALPRARCTLGVLHEDEHVSS
jgi:predicted rRNA methylase YqxC with S4 and FtsJ domains